MGCATSRSSGTMLSFIVIGVLALCARARGRDPSRVWVTAKQKPKGEVHRLVMAGTQNSINPEMVEHIEQRLQGLMRMGYACVEVDNSSIMNAERHDPQCGDDMFLSLHFSVVNCLDRLKRQQSPQHSPQMQTPQTEGGTPSHFCTRFFFEQWSPK